MNYLRNNHYDSCMKNRRFVAIVFVILSNWKLWIELRETHVWYLYFECLNALIGSVEHAVMWRDNCVDEICLKFEMRAIWSFDAEMLNFFLNNDVIEALIFVMCLKLNFWFGKVHKFLSCDTKSNSILWVRRIKVAQVLIVLCLKFVVWVTAQNYDFK